MKLVKRSVYLVLIMLALVALVAACAAPSPSPSPSPTTPKPSPSPSPSPTPTTPAKVYTIVYAIDPTTRPPHSVAIIRDYIKEELKKRSGGQLEVKEVTMGVETGTKGVAMDTVDFSQGMAYGSILPSLDAFNLPGLFATYEDYFRLQFDGGPLQVLARDLLRTVNLRDVAWTDSDLVGVSHTTKPIRVPADAKGIKMRVPPVPILVKFWESLGAAATPIAFAELYTAIQTGIVDAQENGPVTTVFLVRLHEIQKYYTPANYVARTFMIFMSQKSYDRLPPHLQKLVDEIGAEATAMGRAEQAKARDQAFDLMRKAGMEVIEITPQERQLWLDAGRAIWPQLEPMVGAGVMARVREAVGVK